MKKELQDLIRQAKKEKVEIEFYVWTTAKQYRRGIHTDSIDYIAGSLTGLEQLEDENYIVDSAEILDEEELNNTTYANMSEQAEAGERTMVVMLEIDDTSQNSEKSIFDC